MRVRCSDNVVTGCLAVLLAGLFSCQSSVPPTSYSSDGTANKGDTHSFEADDFGEDGEQDEEMSQSSDAGSAGTDAGAISRDSTVRRPDSDRTGRPDPRDTRSERSDSSGCAQPGGCGSPGERMPEAAGPQIEKLVQKAADEMTRVGNPKFDSGPWWKKHWGDDFEGPKPGEDPYCYDKVKPRCMMNYWLGKPCEDTYTVRDNLAEINRNLDDLNKCRWSVYAKHQGESAITAFDPSLVKVRDGKLLLETESVEKSSYDCGSPGKYKDTQWSHDSTNCPFRVGGIESREFEHKGEKGKGFTQTYGRFEVRGKLHDGPGRSPGPAYWLLTAHGVWPYDGEIDIMEVWGKRWPSQYSANYHGGNRAIRSSDKKAPGHTDSKATLKRNVTVKPFEDFGDTFYDDYNTYAIEWSPTQIEYYFNNIKLGEVNAGEGEYRDDLEMCLRLNIPDDPMFFIVNNQLMKTSQTIGAGWPGNDLQEAVDEYESRTHEVDHVRTFKRCETDGDHCPWGGTFNGLNCAVIAVPDGMDPTLKNGKLTYSPISGRCSKGGEKHGDKCVLYEVPSSSKPFLEDGIMYTASNCVESTLTDYCSNPCKGLGHYDGYRCRLGSVPDDMKGYVESGELRYEDKGFLDLNTEKSDCRDSDTYLGESDGCLFADVPEGRSAEIEDDEFVLDPVCSTTKSLMNCPHPCDWGGDFDGRNCHVMDVPGQADPFIHERGFYYTAQSDDPDSACPHGGSYDGANCYLGYRAPPGSEPFIYGDAFYLKPHCGHSPDLQNLPENLFKTSEAETCSPESFPTSPLTYRAHVRFNGWADWKANGETAGEEDAGALNRLQAIQFHIPFNDLPPQQSALAEKLQKRTIRCKAYAANKGWLGWSRGSDYCGDPGKRLEAIRLELVASANGEPPSSNQRVAYRVYVKDDGWTDWKRNGEVAGTTGERKRIEAVEVKLEGF